MTAPHIPTEGTRAQVDALAGLVGLPAREIAAFLEIDLKTLRECYAKELRTANVKANTAVAKALFTSAKEGNTQAQIFWLKTRGKWAEKSTTTVLDASSALKKRLIEFKPQKRLAQSKGR